ncbi:MAG TPA: hypothetical protein VHR72_14045 [Gemmataceae bacterium]|jgi:hypothetical protein|nr:hypothetical protein [Gemmataceae bacterium]
MAEPEMTSRPTNDAYTGMLAIALLALIVGSALMYLDYSQYPMRTPPALPPKAPPPLVVPPAPKAEAPEEKKDETKKDETKKDDAKKDDTKKEELKKDDGKKDADKKDEKKDEKKKSASLVSPRRVSPLLEVGVCEAKEDPPVCRRRRMIAFADVIAERRIDELTHGGPRGHAEAG